MYRFTNDADDEAARAGWGSIIATWEPFEEPPRGEDECGIFPNEVALYAEDEPIPLPESDDFTAPDFFFKEPPRSDGEAYFMYDPTEAYDVSDVRIRFVERRSSRFRVELSAVMYRVFEQPAELRYLGWVRVTRGRGF